MTTQDKDAVELEEAAITHAGYVFQQVRGFVPDEFTWKDAQYGKELGAYGAAFLLGVEFQKQRTVDILKEPPPLGYGMDWYIEKITGIKQREKPVNGELGDD